MGGASAPGKPELHSPRQPGIDTDNCVGCGQCAALYPFDGAVMGDSNTSEGRNCRIAEYRPRFLKDKPHFHLSFIMNVSPECGFRNHNAAAVVPDIAGAASFDPEALDKACADLVIAAPTGLSGRRGGDNLRCRRFFFERSLLFRTDSPP